MKTTVGIALVVTALAATAQSRPDSGPETRGGIEGLKPLMAAARARGADVASVATIAEGLLASEWAIAAPWWLDLVPPDTKMLPAEKETLTKLRRACEKPEAFAEERKIILRLIRQAEALIADKNWEEARQAAGAASGILGLVPDPAMARLLDAVDKRIPPRKPDELPSSRWTKPAWAPGSKSRPAPSAAS